LGFRPEEVAHAGGWSRNEFKELEQSHEVEVEDALVLGDLYGIDLLKTMSSRRFDPKKLPLAGLLKGNATTLTADARFALTAALAAARDYRNVAKAVSTPPPIVSVTSFADDHDLRHPESHNVRRLAERTRKKLDLAGPIRSMVRDVTNPLGVFVVPLPFRDRFIDAVSSWSRETGAVIVVNSDSPRTTSPLGLRVALAHEVCHLLFDRSKMTGIRHFCEVDKPRGKKSGWPRDQESIERRARAYQAELIAPQLDVWEAWGESSGPARERLAALCGHFGLGPEPTAWQLKNGGGPALLHGSLPRISTSANEWTEEDELAPEADAAEVAEVRRGQLLRLVKSAYLDGRLSSSWAREVLRLGVGAWDQMRRQWESL
jgi:Zn-dependent peptidase ImmA (M78 family)